jgi:hypothetical protein
MYNSTAILCWAGCQRTIKQARENIFLNMHWKNKDLDAVTKFLADIAKDQ